MHKYGCWVTTYNNGHTGTSTGFGGDDLAAVLNEATKQASYYKIECGKDRVTIEVVAHCEKCQGTGVLAGKRSQRTCTKCSSGTTPLIPEFEYSLCVEVSASLLAS